VPHVVVTHPCAPRDNLGLIDQLSAQFGATAPVAARAAALRAAIETELAQTRPAAAAEVPVLYLIWREPWMTVARDTYISNMLALVGWRTLPAQDGGERGAARYPAIGGDEGWLPAVQRVLLSSEPYRFTARHIPLARSLCPQARIDCVNGELLSWYGSRAVAGLRYLRGLAGA